MSLNSLNMVSRFILKILIARAPIDLFHSVVFPGLCSCSLLSLQVWLSLIVSRLCIKIVCGSNLKFRMISKLSLSRENLLLPGA